jgi:hypothetical protein
MCKTGAGVVWVSAALLLAAGCATPGKSTGTRFLEAIGIKKPDPELKPASQPEELVKPPEDDARFSRPVAYPQETLDADIMKKKKPSDAGTFGAGGGPPGSRMNMGGMQ